MMKEIYAKAREPMNFLTHFIGVIMSIVATVYMVYISIHHNCSWLVIFSTIVFGLSLVALYSASSYYHYYNGTNEKKLLWLRKLDHSMIYVLIVGTYTPISLYYLPQGENIVFTTILWVIAFIGIIVKLCWMGAPRFLSTLVYILLGWAVLFDFNSFLAIPSSGLYLIAAGGLSYTIGAIIYILKKPNIGNLFGFHEIFHIFILIGSLLHILAICIYVIG